MFELIDKCIRRLRADGFWNTLRYSRHWFFERYHEFRLGIDSAGSINRRKLGVASPDACNYEPIDYRSFQRAVAHLDIRPDRDVFIDYGSGKGRAVIMAATSPFQRVIGVEISPELTAIARQNVARARDKLRCRNIELITADAARYALPADVNVVFLYNPFGGDVLAAVIRNIRASLAACPRTLTLIYKYPSCVENQFSRCDWLALRETVACYSRTGEKLLVYEAVPAPATDEEPALVGASPQLMPSQAESSPAACTARRPA